MTYAIYLLAWLATPAHADNSLAVRALAVKLTTTAAPAPPVAAPPNHAAEPAPPVAAPPKPPAEPVLDLLSEDAPTYDHVFLGPTPPIEGGAPKKKTVYRDRVEIDFEGIDVSGELVKPQGCLVRMQGQLTRVAPLGRCGGE